jgi:hypothetical protein
VSGGQKKLISQIFLSFQISYSGVKGVAISGGFVPAI